jgi:hypothetical protein
MKADELAQRRQELQVRELVQELKLGRTIVLSTDSVEDVGAWRKAARTAGRRLGIPVRTGVSKDGTKVWASEGP